MLLAATLPMSWMMFHGVRQPLDDGLKATFGPGAFLAWVRTAYAPLTEEPAKLWPLLLPWARQIITRESVGRAALALGLGFGVGEIFTLAELIANRQPAIAAMPWYTLGGFITERLTTCIIHGGMTGIALAAWRRGPGLGVGLFLAMVVHYVGNFPIAMAQRGWLGPQKTVAMTIVSLWIFFYFLAAIAWLAWLMRAPSNSGSPLFGEATCPGCGQLFPRSPWTGLNFGADGRYERCPHCHEWHWTTRERPTENG